MYELGGTGTRNYVVATPILYDGRVYVATGQDAEHAAGVGALYCIDPTKARRRQPRTGRRPEEGEAEPELGGRLVHPAEGPGRRPADRGRRRRSGDLLRDPRLLLRPARSPASPPTTGWCTPPTSTGYVFCFDAKTGKLYWVEDTKADVWGQPLWADGKVFVATDSGDVFVFAHGKEKKLLAKIESDEPVRPGLVFANGTLYVTTDTALYAVRSPK